MPEKSSPGFHEYDDQTAEVWDGIAEWWDDKIGDGNDFQNFLIEPASERLLELQHGDCVLDIACGAGRFARRMGTLGAIVVAFDHSNNFIQRARERTTDSSHNIEYKVLNATDSSALMSLGNTKFDAAVCTMGLMDMSSIEPLISTLPRLLKSGGRFVFSVPHPAFNSETVKHVAEQSSHESDIVTKFGVTVTDYAKSFVYKTIGIKGQPLLQHSFHRPINQLFSTCFQHGFVLDGIEEPTFNEDAQLSSRSPFSFANMRLIPPVLVARMRLM